MKKLLTLSILSVLLTFSYGSFAIIVGPPGGCVGATAVFADSTGSGTGTWSTSNPAIATIGATTGIITGVAAGTVTVSYTDGSSLFTAPYTVSPTPTAITGGPTTLCVGGTATFSDAVSGGLWSTSSSYVITISSTTGVATGMHAGLATIQYVIGTGCMASITVTVNAGPTLDSILGPSSVCTGSTITLTDATSGGTWSSSTPAVATISSGGIVSGLSVGTTTISYTVSGICGSSTTTRVISVTSTTSPGSITGTATVTVGATTTLYDATAGGTWSSGSTSIATVSSSGVVTGVAAGTSTISYGVSGCSGMAYATQIVTVTPFDGIAGDVLFTGAAFYGPVKVWLIHYDAGTHMLAGVDSLVTYSSGTSAHYQFTGVATDSFRVKASAIDSMPSTTGYLPTYHTSSAYWYSATVIPHTSGTSDVGKDITMGYGTVTSGPGFIAGDVTMGANKGTAGSIPSVGLLMYLEDEATGAIMQKTYTDAAGHYSFSSLPVGTEYRIYPELINYGTTPYTAITLTTATPSMIAASFEQHTISHTITPIATAVGNVTEAGSFISAFPNPTSGKLNVKWNGIAAQQASVTIADVTGSVVYSSAINTTKGTGNTTIDLSTLSNGMYIMTVKAGNVNYTNKIEIAK